MKITLEQKAIINHEQGHSKVIAVAGSGKTTTLIARILKLLSQGVEPKRILVLMYNKSAQIDFDSRLKEKTAGFDIDLPEIRTFHSLGLSIYRRLVSWGDLPAPTSWNPLSQGRIDGQIMRLLRELAPSTLTDSLSGNAFKEDLADPMLTFMEFAKCSLLSVEDVFKKLNLPDDRKFFIDVFHRFEEQKKAEGLITFSDMIHTPVNLLANNPAITEKLANHMDFILVDEFQDADPCQAKLIQILSGTRANTQVIGDPDQCLYEYRGSVVENIVTHFDNDYEAVTTFPMSRTFRYGPRLALLAGHLISNNKGRADVLCVSGDNTPDTTVSITRTDEEAVSVVRKICEYEKSGTSLADMAIVVRLWAQAAEIELELLEKCIPYQTDSPYTLFRRSETKIMRSILNWKNIGTLSPEERAPVLQSLFEFPRLKVKQQALVNAASILSRQWGEADPEFILSHAGAEEWTIKAVTGRLDILDRIIISNSDSGELLQQYADETGLMDWLDDNSSNHESGSQKVALVEGFISFALRQKMAPEDMCLHLDELSQGITASDQPALTITSVHKAKGLEWDVVLVPGLSEKYMPYLPEKTVTTPGGIESERRLLYVAITRAKRHLEAFAPTKDFSPFIKEMKFSTSNTFGGYIIEDEDLRTDHIRQFLNDGLGTPVIEKYCKILSIDFPQSESHAA